MGWRQRQPGLLRADCDHDSLRQPRGWQPRRQGDHRPTLRPSAPGHAQTLRGPQIRANGLLSAPNRPETRRAYFRRNLGRTLEAVRVTPEAPIIHPAIGPPEGSGPQAQPGVGCRLGQPSLVLHTGGCGRVCSGIWALLLCFWGRNESGSALLTVSDTVMIHPNWLIYSHKSFIHNGLDCVPRLCSRGFFIIWRLKGQKL